MTLLAVLLLIVFGPLVCAAVTALVYATTLTIYELVRRI